MYELPFGKAGDRCLQNRAANALIRGWQLNGILQATSGVPYGVYLCGDIANVGRSDCYMRPNTVGNPNLSNPTLSKWYDPNAFASRPINLRKYAAQYP